MKTTLLWISLFIGCISCSNTSQLANGEIDVELDGLRINYTIRGKGPIMIAGHLNSGKIGYELTLKPLEEKFTMVYYSPRGTGSSVSPKSIEEYKYEFLVEEIELLRKHLKTETVWIFGHSDQSLLGLQYAIEYPHHIAGLILSGTHFIPNEEEEKAEKLNFENERKQDAWFAQVINDLNYRYQFQTNIDSAGRDLTYASLSWWCYDSTSVKKVIPVFNAISQAGRRKAIDGQYPFSSPKASEQLINRTLHYQTRYAELKTKVFIIQGAYDTNNPPKLAEQLQQEIKNSELVFIEKAGHFPWVENSTESFDQIFSWLNTNGF